MKRDYKMLGIICWSVGIGFMVFPIIFKAEKGNILAGSVSVLLFLIGTMFWLNRKQ